MKRLPLLPLVSLVLLAGCQDGGTPAARSAAPPAPTATMPVFLRVTTGAGRPLLVIDERDRTTTITSLLGGTKVTIAGQDGRYTRGGRVLAVVKTYADGVKLKTTSGRTLWRAKVSAAGRLQIRRGETALRYEFRPEAGGRVKVEQRGTEIGDVRAVERGAAIENANGATLGRSASPPDEGMAVLLCREIPPDLRAVLAATLPARR